MTRMVGSERRIVVCFEGEEDRMSQGGDSANGVSWGDNVAQAAGFMVPIGCLMQALEFNLSPNRHSTMPVRYLFL